MLWKLFKWNAQVVLGMEPKNGLLYSAAKMNVMEN